MLQHQGPILIPISVDACLCFHLGVKIEQLEGLQRMQLVTDSQQQITMQIAMLREVHSLDLHHSIQTKSPSTLVIVAQEQHSSLLNLT